MNEVDQAILAISGETYRLASIGGGSKTHALGVRGSDWPMDSGCGRYGSNWARPDAAEGLPTCKVCLAAIAAERRGK